MALEKSQGLLVLLILCQILYIVSGTCNNKGQCWKTTEKGNSPVSYHVCGGWIPVVVYEVCNDAMMLAYGRNNRQKHRKPAGKVAYKKENDAKRFYISKRQFNIVEECCAEGCASEEVREYC